MTIMAMTTSCNEDQNHTQACKRRHHQLSHAQDRWGANVRKFERTEVHSAAPPQQ